jgi:hypothetical protein
MSIAAQEISEQKLQKIIKEFQSSQDYLLQKDIEKADQLFLAKEFELANQQYSKCLQIHTPQNFNEMYEYIKTLWKRANCFTYLNAQEDAMNDFNTIIEFAESMGYKLDMEQQKRLTKEEKWEYIRKGYDFLIEESKEYIREKWNTWKRRAKMAWKFIKKKYKEQNKSQPNQSAKEERKGGLTD